MSLCRGVLAAFDVIRSIVTKSHGIDCRERNGTEC